MFTFHVSRFTFHVSRFTPDPLIGLLLCLAGAYAYIDSLAPTVLEGDAALFQFTPGVLGVTYPTGYPLYILLGKLWLTLFPFGEIAWRMNLFSALCSALALPLIYGAARRWLAGSGESEAWPARWAALAAVLIFATLPTFWRWSTETKIYGLNILLFSGLLYTLAKATAEREASLWDHRPPTADQTKNEISRTTDDALRTTPQRVASSWDASRFTFYGLHPFFGCSRFSTKPLLGTLHSLRSALFSSPLTLPALLLGLQITVHSTTVLLVPGLLLFAWLHLRPYLLNKKLLPWHALALILPGLLYFYIPLRAEWLIARYGRQEAVMRGLLADFYHSGWSGWLRYFTAADFTGGVVTNWGLVPQQVVTVYWRELLFNEFTVLGMGLGLVGGLGLALLHPRRFWSLFFLYAVPIPFVLTYGQGEQSAFLLPSFLIFSMFAGYTLVLIHRILTYLARFRSLRFTFYVSRFSSPLLLLVLVPALILPHVRYNINWLGAKWSRAIYNEWADALAHPLPPGAAVLAHWGDLTSFWYMQHAEGRRPDLRGLYPPTEETVTGYLQHGGGLFIAGPLQGWAAGIEDRYQLLPWGRLVRIAPRQADPQELLPAWPHPVEAVFAAQLRLVGADFPTQAVDGSLYPVSLGWQALAELPPETTLSLRLSQGETIVAQLDDTLLSGWFPRPTLPVGQFGLSYMPIAIPPGTLPGKYRLQMVAYTSYKHPWPLADGTALFDLGEVELVLPHPANRPASLLTGALAGYDFNGEIELADYEYTANRVSQGKGFGLKLLWRTRQQPEDNYVLHVELVDAAGQVLRAVDLPPVGGRAPTASWQPGQVVRDQVDMVLPASAPAGEEAVRVRLSWLRPNGSPLNVRRWLLPIGHSLDLDWLAVTEKERVFEAPPVQYPVGANLDNKARLIGFNSSLPGEPVAGNRATLRFSPADCPADCTWHFDLYWQGMSEMDALYFVFLHLVDEQGQLVSQHDRGPGKRGKEPTTGWLPGEVIADPVDLPVPAGLPPGRYTLRLGMYLPPLGPRLPVVDGEPGSDFIEVGTVEVRP